MSGLSKPLLLFIDDSKSQLALYRSQMEDQYEVALAVNFEEAMAALSSRQPDLVVLDLVMPQVDGFEFLSILRGTKKFEKLPVIMVSSENDPQLIRRTFLLGAGDFIRKPYDEVELRLRVQRLLDLAPRSAQEPQDEKRLSISAKALMIESLMELSLTRDNETGHHLTRLRRYVEVLARAAAEVPAFRPALSEELLESIGEISVLHDIGKVGIPDNILWKPGPLTPLEFEVMKTHTTIGADTIAMIRKRFPQYKFLEWAREIALSHHERWDGSGYPEGLLADQIPLPARIVAVADVFDALTTKRVYKEAYSLEEALNMMKENRGGQFDPRLFDVFLGCLPEFEAILARYARS